LCKQVDRDQRVEGVLGTGGGRGRIVGLCQIDGSGEQVAFELFVEDRGVDAQGADLGVVGAAGSLRAFDALLGELLGSANAKARTHRGVQRRAFWQVDGDRLWRGGVGE